MIFLKVIVYYTTNAGKIYACSVVALCNLMKYYKFKGYVKTSAYNYLQIADGWSFFISE